MKTSKIIFAMAVFGMLLFPKCAEDEPVVFYNISGTVSYSGGNATGAHVYLAEGNAPTTLYTRVTITDETGKYTFSDLPAGDYFLWSDYFTADRAATGRLSGIYFVSGDDNLVAISNANISQNISLQNQAGNNVSVNNIDGAWTLDRAHSEVVFEFPFNDTNATFSGRFNSYDIEIKLDDNDLANSSVKAIVDLTTVNTGQPGRDGGHNCISRTFGIQWNDNGTADDTTDDTIIDNSGEAMFVSTSIEFYGDGYLAKGNLTFNGTSSSIEVMFKFIPGYQAENRSGVLTQFSSFEAKFSFDAINDHGVSSSQNLNNVEVFASYQLNKPV